MIWWLLLGKAVKTRELTMIELGFDMRLEDL
jgi:hypothetical protein